ncbi:MAG: hypothetical protein NWQ23_09390 [Yoonia sp.]|uniref:hypothetical protein n=1 Tax=Yoonia sp. TaxID=2212373 RepID=UPI00273D80E5|nr:hypothetical protein [Yoonia sp.]MDP5085621.1 hypothetical protein [Yoonia sp.]MDP5362852.1 hypothetical protein [Paracoccaceae bacterium]
MFVKRIISFLQKSLAAPVAVVLLSGPLWAETTLLMAEEPGCMWCARWNTEISAIYPKTDEGAAAPLRRMNIQDPVPEDIALARRINFTPTFVLLVDGVERNRMEGYPGEDFFWGLLARMLDQEGITYASKSE